MTNREYNNYLERNLGKNFEHIKYRGVSIPFSSEAALRRGIFISGNKKSGKTNLMKIFADDLMGKVIKSDRVLTKGQPIKVVVKILDSSQAWLNSSIPYYQVITFEEIIGQKWENPININMIFELSKLMPMDQKIFIGEFLGDTFEFIVDNPIPHFIFVIVEEAQLILPSGSLRALYSQAALRHITVGRNYDLGSASLTQFAAMVSTNVIKQAGLCYMGLAFEENDIRKLRNFIGWKKDKTRKIFSSLKIGEFVYLKTGRNATALKIKTPEFIPKSEPEEWVPQRKQSFWRKLFK